MNLINFCNNQASKLCKESSVILFESKKPVPIAFAHIIAWLEQNSMIQNIKFLDLEQDLEQLKITLQTTFLGQSQQFIIGDLSLVTKKKRTEFLQFLQWYQGPHQIIGCLIDQEETKIVATQHLLIVSIESSYHQDNIHELPFLYDDQKRENIAYFFVRLFRIRKELNLEQICLLHRYAQLIGKNIDIFFQEWIEQLIVNDVSLFFIAQLFFEKKPDAFFQHWHWIRPYYSDQFWTTFFSDQIFKACLYVHMNGQIAQAQKPLIYGLPFSFLKHDWRWHNTQTLQQAHNRLYNVDLALKINGNALLLDNFVLHYFAAL